MKKFLYCFNVSMISDIDIRTLIISVYAIMLVLTSCMIFYCYNLKTYDGFKAWTIGCILHTLGFILIGFRNVLPDFVTIVIANSIGLLAMVIYYKGFSSYVEEEFCKIFHASIIVIYALFIFPFYTYIKPDVTVRIVVASFLTAFYFFLCLKKIYQSEKNGEFQSNKLIVTTLVFFTVLYLTRGIFYFFPENKVGEYVTAGNFYAFNLILSSMVSVGFVIGLMQLNSQKLESEREGLINNLQIALAEVKTLKGIVPICSNCKKIRDDKGCWNLLEYYIEKHSEASFSHSICPECFDKFYGKEEWYIKMKK